MTEGISTIHIVHQHVQDGSDENDPSDISNSYYAFSDETKADDFCKRMEKVFEDTCLTYVFSLKVDNPESWEELEGHESEFESEDKSRLD